MPDKVNILIIEPDNLLREKMAGILSRVDKVKMVVQVPNSKYIAELCSEINPQIIVINVTQALARIDVVARLRDIYKDCRILVTSDDDGNQYLDSAEQLGASHVVKAHIYSETKKIIDEITDDFKEMESYESGSVGSHVIVADDDAFYRQRISKGLSGGSLNHKCVKSGEQAIAALIADPGKYSCIVLDVHMERMSGIETADYARKLDPDIPVLFISSDDTPEIQEAVIEIPGSSFLKKPFTAEQLNDEIKILMNFKHHQGDENADSNDRGAGIQHRAVGQFGRRTGRTKP